ncbi:MAG: hypothetical protein ABUS79_03620 [Pseudomonadota bacterium]
MRADIAALTRAGVYRKRPKVGNGVSGDCPKGPCGYVSCRHHLKLDVNPETGAVKDNFPDLDVDEMEETCSLRVAESVPDGETLDLDKVGRYLNITMEWTRRMEASGIKELKRKLGRTRRGQKT